MQNNKQDFTDKQLEKIYNLRKKGATYDEIAKKIGLKKRQNFFYYVKKNQALKDIIKLADEERYSELSNNAIDILLKRLLPQERKEVMITTKYNKDDEVINREVKEKIYTEEVKSSEIIFILERLLPEDFGKKVSVESKNTVTTNLMKKLNDYRGLEDEREE